MFDRILVPLDGTATATNALIVGARLAERWQADLTILTLIRRGDRILMVDKIVAEQAEKLAGPVSVEIRDLAYSVVEDIAEEFDEVDRTLVVMSTEARGRTAGLIGNTAEDVFRHTRQAMVLVGPDDVIPDEWPSGPFLVCTDGSDFAESVADDAAAWADALALRIEVVTVVDPAKVPAGVPMVGEINTPARMARRLTALLPKPIDYEALHGPDPAVAIADHAKGRRAALIALATHGRTGLDRVAHGSVAMDVVRRSRCPVLISRPPTVTTEGAVR